jgi:glycosyltransferase 2 family protein
MTPMDSLERDVDPSVGEEPQPEVDVEGLPMAPVHRRWMQKARASVLGPHGGGTTRRRASDAVRLGLAVVIVAVCIPLARANTAFEVHLATLVAPAPNGVHWLFTALWFFGSLGVIVGLVLLGLFVPRLAAVRHMAIAGVATLGVCLIMNAVLGPAAGRPPIPELAGFDARFPVTQLAVAIAVALTALPYLSRPLHRLVGSLIALAALAAIVDGYGLPVNVIASVALGWGIAAACHLVTGSPDGLPSAAEVTDAVRDLRVDVRDLTAAERQEWGVQEFAGRDAQDRRLELSVYGRDAADAQWLRKVWRFCVFRDSGPTLTLNRQQQVEHEAYLTFLAAHTGVLVPEVLAAGQCGPSHDAALITRLPAGARLAELDAAQVSDDDLEGFLRSVCLLRGAGIAHVSLSPDTVVATGAGALLRDFRRASSSAPAERTDRDLAAAVSAAAVVVGVERTVAASRKVLDEEAVTALLPHLQRSTLSASTNRLARTQKGLLTWLREALASSHGVEVPKLVEPKRISWPNLLMVVGSLVGLWLIIGVLSDVSESLSTIRGADWGWVVLAFVLAQLPVITNAWALTGAVLAVIPFGRCMALEASNFFTAFVGGDAAVFGVRVRFFQRQGLIPTAALSSGAIAGTASWVVKGGLFLVCLPFALGDFHKPDTTGGNQGLVWVILVVVLVVAVLAAVVALVPRIRRLLAEKARPHVASMWSDLKGIASEPRKIFSVLAGALASQVLIALSLGAALHSVGEHASFATIIVVLTVAAMIGGAVPVPNGLGVVEAGMIAGLTAAGIPQSQAVAAVFIQRICSAYIPPVYGWVTLVFMRRREYI